MRAGVSIFACSVLLAAGCDRVIHGTSRTPAEQQMFGPSGMRIHPIFTRIRDWTGDGRPDGIDALIELQDPFGDPTKAAGQVIFELYKFQKFEPDHRGARVCNPFVGSIQTLDEQRDRWNRTSRTYSFPLSYPQIRIDDTYVLTAEFQLASGGRFFDSVVIEPAQGAYAPKGFGEEPTTQSILNPSTQPTTQPSNGPTTEPGSRPPQP